MRGDGVLNAFFYSRLKYGLHLEGLQPSDYTFVYLLGLLRDPLRVDMEQTLFDMYKKAMTSVDHGTRFESFRCLGDASLFMAGIFQDYVDRTLVGKEYYVAMGRLGYMNAAGMAKGGMSPALKELSNDFIRFIDAFSHVRS